MEGGTSGLLVEVRAESSAGETNPLGRWQLGLESQSVSLGGP